jgi:hypothetical protein
MLHQTIERRLDERSRDSLAVYIVSARAFLAKVHLRVDDFELSVQFSHHRVTHAVPRAEALNLREDF